MLRSFTVIITCLLVVFVACKKTEQEEAIVIPPANFQPFGAGSTWSYADYPFTELYSVTMTGLDTTLLKKKYHEVFTTGYGLSWMRKDAGTGYYYKLIAFPDTLLEFNYLRDASRFGDKWQQKYEIEGVETTYKYSIAEYDVKKMINSIIFDHCITVQEDMYVDLGGVNDSLISTEKYTYANDIGLVYINKNPPHGDIYLKSYQIKP